MGRREVWDDPSTPPSSSPSSSAATCDSSESSSDDNFAPVCDLSTARSTSPSSPTATSDSSESSDDNSAPVVSRTKCMNPRRRLIGGRVYDSVLGVTCHWCRQKTVEDHVFCCHCNLAFCGGCLRNRHGEDIEIEMKDDVEWTCPKCRGGCGWGCKNCCNCGPCRKAQGLEPTGLLVHTARARGFTNVHDYLIHQKTGESEETIAKRKQGKGWCHTNPASFWKKQKRNEDENGLEATCRKRLNFTSSEKDLHEKKMDKSTQSNALQIKEASPASNMSKDEKLSLEVSVQNTDGSPKQPKSKELRPPSESPTIVQLKPEPDLHVHTEPCQKSALVHVKDEQITHENDAHPLKIAQKGPSEPDLLPKHGVSTHALGTLMKVKTEKEPLCSNEILFTEQTIKGRHLMQVKKETLDQPSQLTEGLNVQLIRVKEESQDQCSQPFCDNVSTNKPNIFAAAFSRGEGDATWCRFSEDFEVPSENVEGYTSTSAFLNSETPRNTGDARPWASPSASNFHLYPESLPSVFFHVKEVVDGQHVLRSDVTVKLESTSSQKAQCNPCCPLTNNGCKDASICAIQFPTRFPVCERTVPIATVKEEREEVRNVHCPTPVTNSLLNTVKVKTERKDFSFTIEPSECRSISKSERLPLSQVKEEVFVDTPMSKVIRIDDEPLTVSGTDKPEIPVEIPEGLKKSRSLGAVSHLWKVDDFKNRLEAKLSEPFSRKELEELAAAASHRKPIYKARETRQGCFEFISNEEGFSYLDHHPDLDLQLKEAISPIARLSLLRGFFFWLEHASTHGAFKPWTSVSRSPEVRENDDCVEIEGPDCEILAVVCSVDEEVSGENWSRMRKNSIIVL